MKVGFVTCVQLGLSCIHAIYDAGGRIDFAVTLPDDKARTKSGRVYLDEFCAERGVPLVKTPHVNDPTFVEFLRQEQPDWLFIIGWSQIAGPGVLRAARRGVVGMHPTLLPEGRGRAAIPWAIIKGLTETGVTMFVLDEGVDTGPILAQLRLPLAPDETATSLYARVDDAHARLMRETWPQIAAGTANPRAQDERRATVWPGRTPADGELLPSMTVAEAERLVRAVTRPYPGAFVRDAPNARVIRVWAGRPAGAAAVAGAVRLEFADGGYDAAEWEVVGEGR